jgi:hypothetical protein
VGLHESFSLGLGPTKQRLGTQSQLPFGYCALSLYPAEDAVVSPSGHLYSRESVLEYLLSKSKDLKVLREQYEEQQVRNSYPFFNLLFMCALSIGES